MFLDLVGSIGPDRLVQLEALGHRFRRCAQRQHGGEGYCVFECLGAALCLVFWWVVN